APGVLANDTDVDAGDTRTAVVVVTPAHGTLLLNANGSFRYTPATGYSGPDTFQYKAKDAAGAFSNVATVSITVTPLHAYAMPPANTNPAGQAIPPAVRGRIGIVAVVVNRGLLTVRVDAVDAIEVNDDSLFSITRAAG